MKHWLDSLTAGIAPRWTMRRLLARIRLDLVQRHYESGAAGRRTQTWNRSSSDANAANAMGGLSTTRQSVRDLVRNNAYAESALSTIVDHAVGWGIVAKPNKTTSTRAAQNQAADRWARWAETTACAADGRVDFPGLQKLVMRSVAQDGEVLIRRRWRRPEDGLPIPMQLQVLEADYLDTSRDGIVTPSGGRIIQGVEFDPIGRRVGYWLFAEHPGAAFVGVRGPGASASVRIPATDMLHVFKPGRPGQVRATSWFAPVTLKLADLDRYEDATLQKQMIAACLGVIITDQDGTSTPLGTSEAAAPDVDTLYPGMIHNFPVGKTATVIDPPSVNEHDPYTQTILRAIATGLGVTYEDLTGNYQGLPFSAARMSRLRHWARVEDWRWRMLIPQFCDPVWAWAMEAAVIAGTPRAAAWDVAPTAEWTCPPLPMLDPDAEARAYMTALRIGAKSWPEMQRELGYDPEVVFTEILEWQKKMAAAGMILDGDPSTTTQAGLPRNTAPVAAPVPVTSPTSTNGAHL